MKLTSVEEFYKEFTGMSDEELKNLLPEDISREIGHFNIFNTAEVLAALKRKPGMPYNRRAYYKVSLIGGRNRAEYADKVILIRKNALLFATPRVPYHWIPEDDNQSGDFCIFTAEFMDKAKSGVVIDKLPIFQPGGHPLFELSDEQTAEIREIFHKMNRELSSDYPYKYDLIRNYVMELIHYGQKLQPHPEQKITANASRRVSSLFIELLERQFPIESRQQRLRLRTAADFADQLAVHVNHLNKVLKEVTGNTTTTLINGRILQEAKILLKQTDWSVSEIAFSLGFEEIAHFSNFFKKHTAITPLAFRT